MSGNFPMSKYPINHVFHECSNPIVFHVHFQFVAKKFEAKVNDPTVSTQLQQFNYVHIYKVSRGLLILWLWIDINCQSIDCEVAAS